ncbi:MAG: hypothetical protein FJ145_02410 [Deltaproteobacteria bacterium]|nr:hypothetical protein [Deltaproteobacteria bacterium]
MRRKLGALLLGLVLAGVVSDRASAIPLGKPAPEIAGSSWINSAPLTTKDLRGQVVLVEFWTYG